MADRFTTPECPDNEPSKKFVILPPVRPVPDCDPPLEIPEPDYSSPDEPFPDVTGPTLFPLPIEVFGATATMTCQNGSKGEPSVVTGAQAGALLFFFQDTDELTSSELKFIRQRQDDSMEHVTLTVESGTVEEIASLLNISITKAGLVQTAFNTVELEADAKVEDVATAGLVCRWESVATTVYCENDALLTGEDLEKVAYNPAHSEAGAYKSQISQADADEQARLSLEASLVCIWKNPLVTVYCSDVGFPLLDPGQPDLAGASGENLGVEDPDHPITPFPGVDGRYRVNQVTIEDHLYESDESAQAARDRAEEIALVMLDCFYVNPEVTAECPPPKPGEEPPGWNPITYDGSNTGNPVTVTEGYVASEVSWEDAEEQAEELAVSALICQWRSRAFVYACDDDYSDPGLAGDREMHLLDNYPKIPGTETPDVHVASFKKGKAIYVTSLEETLDIMASPWKSNPYSIEVPAEFYTSDISQADADELAANFAIAQLICIYCNPRIDPVCSKSGEEGTPEEGLIPIPPQQTPPLPGPPAGTPPEKRDPHTMELPIPADWVDGTWSMDATLGVPGIVYVPGATEADHWRPNPDFFEETEETQVKTFQCNVDPYEAVTVADILGMVPVTQMSPKSRNEHCQYGNRPHYAACWETSIPLPEDLPPDSVRLAPFYPLKPGETDYSSYFSTHSTEGYVVVPKDSVQAESIEAADLLAEIQALSILNCFYESPELLLYCGATTAEKDRVIEGLESSFASESSPIQIPKVNPGVIITLVHSDSKGYYPGKGVTVPYGCGLSYSTPQDAYDQALLLGLGQLDCFWRNGPYTAKCDDPIPDHYVPKTGSLMEYAIEVGRYRSYDSQGDADTLAKLVADSQLRCLYTNEDTLSSGLCPPGETLLSQIIIQEQFMTSPESTDDANTQAKTLADALQVCLDDDVAPDEAYRYWSSAWGVSAAPGGGGGGSSNDCCNVSITSLSHDTVLFMPQDEETPVTVDFIDTTSCAKYVYLAVDLTFKVDTVEQLQWELGPNGAQVLFRTSKVEAGDNVVGGSVFVPNPFDSGYVPVSGTVYKLIAEIHRKKQDCSDMVVMQSMTKAQKIVVARTVETNRAYPMIVDRDTPSPVVNMVSGGAFFGTRVAANNDIFLQGGTVGVGTKNTQVNEFKIYDGVAKKWTGTLNQHVILEVHGNGQVSDGILDPIYNGTQDLIVPLIQDGVPDNTVPTANNHIDRVCNIDLGYFHGTTNSVEGFSAAAAGNRQIYYCWGSYSITP